MPSWLPGIPTGEFDFGLPALAYTFVLPAPITLAAGDWVGIADYPDEIGNHHHYWLTSSDGDGSIYFTEGFTYDSDLAFCLGGGVPQTPLSNWALIIGVILIGTFVIVRFRRLI